MKQIRQYPAVQVSAKGERSVLYGHPWIYDAEVTLPECVTPEDGSLVDAFGPDAVAAGVDAKNGIVAVEGWEALSGVGAEELCLRMKADGVRHIIYTDISRDGMLTGPNVEATKALTEATDLDVIASGGMSSMEDLERLCAAGIRGAIIGKALYEGRIDLSLAVRRFQA